MVNLWNNFPLLNIHIFLIACKMSKMNKEIDSPPSNRPLSLEETEDIKALRLEPLVLKGEVETVD